MRCEYWFNVERFMPLRDLVAELRFGTPLNLDLGIRWGMVHFNCGGGDFIFGPSKKLTHRLYHSYAYAVEVANSWHPSYARLLNYTPAAPNIVI